MPSDGCAYRLVGSSSSKVWKALPSLKPRASTQPSVATFSELVDDD